MKSKENIKLIASDLDNTLLLPGGELPEDFFDLVETLYTNEIFFAPASGRPYASLVRMFAPVLDKIVCIADNGGYIKFGDETIFTSEIERSAIDAFIDFTLEETNGIPILFSPKHCYTIREGLKYKETFENFMANLVYVEDLYQIDDQFDKFTIYLPDKNSTDICNTLYKPQFGEDYYITTGDDYFIDIQNKDCNKGTALIETGKYFGITTKEMMAFGDHMNDKELVETAYFGYAVENAFDKLKESARFTTSSNADRGVIKTIQEVLEAKQNTKTKNP